LDVIDAIEAAHGVIVGEDHGWGESRLAALTDFARWTLSPTAGPFASTNERARRLAARVAETRPDSVVHYQGNASPSALWEAEAIRKATPTGVAFTVYPPEAPAAEP